MPDITLSISLPCFTHYSLLITTALESQITAADTNATRVIQSVTKCDRWRRITVFISAAAAAAAVVAAAAAAAVAAAAAAAAVDCFIYQYYMDIKHIGMIMLTT